MNPQTLRAKWPLGIGAAIGLAGLLFVLLHDLTLPMHSSPESLAVGRLRDIFNRQEEFRAMHNGCFAKELSELRDARSRDQHYIYALEPLPDGGCIAKYTVTAFPVVVEKNSRRYFFMDETGTMRFEMMHPANSSSSILQ